MKKYPLFSHLAIGSIGLLNHKAHSKEVTSDCILKSQLTLEICWGHPIGGFFFRKL
jgi:hypothetical protein